MSAKILGFGHPSGAMENGARGKILVFKQWKWTDYYINYVESVYRRVQIQFSTQNPIYKGSQNGFFGFLHKKWLARWIFYDWPYVLKNLKWRVVPKKAQIWPCAGFLSSVSTPESDSPRKITSIKGLGTVFFGFLHKKRLAGRIFSEGRNFFTIDPMLEKSQVKSGPKKAQIWPCAGFFTPISTPESNSPRKNTSIKGLGTVFFSFLHKKCLAGRIFSGRFFF